MTLLKSHICKPRVSKCSYETHTMRTQVNQAKSYRNTMAPHPKWSASSSHRFDCKPNGRSPLQKFVPSTGPNKFSYGFFWGWIWVSDPRTSAIRTGVFWKSQNNCVLHAQAERWSGDLRSTRKIAMKNTMAKEKFFCSVIFFSFWQFLQIQHKKPHTIASYVPVQKCTSDRDKTIRVPCWLPLAASQPTCYFVT